MGLWTQDARGQGKKRQNVCTQWEMKKKREPGKKIRKVGEETLAESFRSF